MNEEINDIVIKLKSSLKSRYGDNFNKFYLVNFNDDEWEGLISIKDDNGKRNGEYYKIDNGTIIPEPLIRE
tara:strand:- start:10793 stop:11005 length:213 start_codon:yes stop_codon:yes gene_type:complete